MTSHDVLLHIITFPYIQTHAPSTPTLLGYPHAPRGASSPTTSPKPHATAAPPRPRTRSASEGQTQLATCCTPRSRTPNPTSTALPSSPRRRRDRQ
jgi:hypothetical protein